MPKRTGISGMLLGIKIVRVQETQKYHETAFEVERDTECSFETIKTHLETKNNHFDTNMTYICGQQLSHAKQIPDK